MRWVRLGEAHESARAEAAAVITTNRFKAMAVYYGADADTLAASFDANSLRWFRLGEAYATSRAQAAAMAMTHRYQALAEYCSGQPVAAKALLCSASHEQLEP
jgi:hypothetical protein